MHWMQIMQGTAIPIKTTTFHSSFPY